MAELEHVVKTFSLLETAEKEQPSFVTVSLITATVVINIATEHDVTALAALAGTSFVVDGTWAEVASLNAQLKTSKSEFDKLKFARDAYTIGRHPSIRMGLALRRKPRT